MLNGFAGKVLHVNLTSRELSIEEPDEAFYRLYPGGSLMGLYYLWHNTTPGIVERCPDGRRCMFVRVGEGLVTSTDLDGPTDIEYTPIVPVFSRLTLPSGETATVTGESGVELQFPLFANAPTEPAVPAGASFPYGVLSFAIVGPLSKVVSMQTIFLVAGLAPIVLAAVAVYAAKMRRDEVAHPLR